MKSMLKSVLIVLCLFVFFSSVFDGSSTSTKPNVNEDINIFEENIENGSVIEEDSYLEEDVLVLEGNLFGKFGYIICKFFVNTITGFIKLIVELIGKIV